MLFNSPIFLFGFLPVTSAGFLLLGGRHFRRPARLWLIGASLLFYAWWEPSQLPILLGSILLNFATGFALNRTTRRTTRRVLLLSGVTLNLTLLGFFKYATFVLTNVNDLLGTSFSAAKTDLPLAISFFTFTQIAYLVDSYRVKAPEYSLEDYALFACFFPHLIAGPIVHHWQLLPQFLKPRASLTLARFTPGFTMFLLGLFEKVLIADPVAGTANAVFSAASRGDPITFVAAWIGALAYAVQIYFDFSGYSDMAIGLANMFGVKFPENFNSPYQARSIIEFWSRWHITLSQFLREYVYIPLGGNRKGIPRRYANLMVTMLLGGLWHGAGWTLVIWGTLHGLYLVVNHAWRAATRGWLHGSNSPVVSWSGRFLTFVAVVLAWVIFRADSWHAAVTMLSSMARISVAAGESLQLVSVNQIAFILGAMLLSWFAPNSQQWLAHQSLVIESVAPTTWPSWRPTFRVGLAFGILLFLVIKSFFALAPAPFIYFQF